MLTAEQSQFYSGHRVEVRELASSKVVANPAPMARDAVTGPAKATRAEALKAIGTGAFKQLQDAIEDIVLTAKRNGIDDLSGREIQQRYEAQYIGKRIEASTISSRVNSLIAANRLERGPERPCKVTGRNILPVRPVAQQARLTA